MPRLVVVLRLRRSAELLIELAMQFSAAGGHGRQIV